MSTIYFTNNASSGDGSLRAAITGSTSGDRIEPDLNVDWGGETIEILISSNINLASRNLTISGGPDHRIRFDGQGAAQLFSVVNFNGTFEKCDFVRGYRSAYGAAFNATNGSPTYIFKACLFAGNRSGTSGQGAISSNSNSYKSTLECYNCVITGEYYNIIAGGRTESAIYNACTFTGNCGARPTTNSEYNDCVLQNSTYYDGFINSPPENPTTDEWTEDDWTAYDLRLKPGSVYLNGYTGSEAADFLGHERKTNGARGAFEGAWLVVGEVGTAIAENVTADYCEIGGDVEMTGATDQYITIVRESKIDATKTIESANGGYFATPTGTTGAHTDNVIECYSGANLQSFDAVEIDAATIGFNATYDAGRYFLIEKQTGATWQTVAKNGTNETETAAGSYSTKIFRAFDGVNFFYATISAGVVEYWRDMTEARAFADWTARGYTLAPQRSADPIEGEEEPDETSDSWTARAYIVNVFGVEETGENWRVISGTITPNIREIE